MNGSSLYMMRALGLARAAAMAGEVPVGAVIVDPVSGEIIAEGQNAPIAGHDPTAHAEIAAIRAAGERIGNYRLNGLDIYVTLEPCMMCAGAISFARLQRVIFAARDEKGGAVVSGPLLFEQPTCHWRPEIIEDASAADEAAKLLRAFFQARRER